jgi:hypothetical protein
MGRWRECGGGVGGRCQLTVLVEVVIVNHDAAESDLYVTPNVCDTWSLQDAEEQVMIRVTELRARQRTCGYVCWAYYVISYWSVERCMDMLVDSTHTPGGVDVDISDGVSPESRDVG